MECLDLYLDPYTKVANLTGFSRSRLTRLASGYGDPCFEDDYVKEVVAHVGQTVLLPCAVKSLGTKVVSWMRSKDVHVLTVGSFTFTGDTRFEAVHTDSSEEFWGLRIRGVKLDDAGRYECQVNTEPKKSLGIVLKVGGEHSSDDMGSNYVGEATIHSPATIYAQLGSPITIRCSVIPLSTSRTLFFVSRPPVRWLHDEREISYEFKEDTNVTIHTEYSQEDQKVTSELNLASVTWRDAGKYTCMQPSSKSDNVQLIVVEGEHSEAMQRDSPLHSSGRKFSFAWLYIIVLLSTNIL
nr:unnamed protein product [Callosobruchus chinensis]